MKLEYNEVVANLRGNVCRVTFEKVDGTLRVMDCTLNQSFLPEFQQGYGTSLITEGDGEFTRVSVWDTQNAGWRSFRLNTVKNFEVVKPLPL